MIKVHTDGEYAAADLKLLELNPALEEAIKSQESIVFCGNASEGAVLCTPNKSFQVLEEETSNLVLLVSDNIKPFDKENNNCLSIPVSGSSSSFLQVVEKHLRPATLRSFLAKFPYPNTSNSLATMDYMIEHFQQSCGELLQLLNAVNAFEVGGVWFLLDEKIMQQTFSQILDLIIENELPLGNISEDMFDEVGYFGKEYSPGVRSTVVRQCLVTHAKKQGKKGYYVLDPVKTAAFRANELLLEREGHSIQWPLLEFFEKLQIRLPDGIEPTESILKGLATTKQGMISYFPESRLSTDPLCRFKELFRHHPTWLLAELQPYIVGLLDPLNSESSLLLKFTRTSRIPGSKEFKYSSRD